MRLEPILIALSLACYGVGLLHLLGAVSLAGRLHMSLYAFYSLAVALGWLAGNVYVHRSRGVVAALRRRLLLVYMAGPPGLLFLLRAMAPLGEQLAAPLVAVYGFGVFTVLFMVPVTLSGGKMG